MGNMGKMPHRAKLEHWRKLLLLLVVLMASLYSSTSSGASLTLGWDEVSDSNISGYTVYYGTNTLQYTASRFVRVPTVTIPGLIPGIDYYFAVSAQSVSGLQSPLSEELVFEIPWISIALDFLPPRPDSPGLRMWFYPVPDRIHELQTSTDLKEWSVVAVLAPSLAPARYDFVDYPASGNRNRFYRVVVRPR